MFKKILIANRGEIACRIIRTAKRMGIATVAVYSEADADALHVREADEAVLIGPAPSAESYLRIDKIVTAAKSTGANAVHPGYGFLSERAEFAAALAVSGIAFIGPGSEAIAAMGDKIAAKKLATAAGVSTVPGYLGTLENDAEARRIANEIGYPVIVKAAAGGGGKGMRIAASVDDIAEAVRAARAEAKTSFADDRVFIEKYIERPRHIEIQTLADLHGNVLHLGERECSLQRRHQKVTEEAPSPFLDESTRTAMGAQAVELARAVGYVSAGTVEFIVDPDRHFYFLEMNTRLQVEHPVTEAVTGLDLVEWMIRIAAGEKLPFAQSDIKLEGWAIEARIYAEDPARNFLPSVGRLKRYTPPSGLNVRVDSGVYEGAEISLYYDPMIAKLIAKASDRVTAIEQLGAALDAFEIRGPSHNIAFLSALLRLPEMISGDLTTHLIGTHYPEGFTPSAPNGEVLAGLFAIAAARAHRDSFTAIPTATHFVLRSDGCNHQVSTRTIDGGVEVLVDGWTVTVIGDLYRGLRRFAGTVNNREVTVQLEPIGRKLRLSQGGNAITVEILSPRAAELMERIPVKPAADLSRYLLSPMPGLLVKLIVGEGDEVKAGEALVMVEAMKMENVLKADHNGTIAKIHARQGDHLAVDEIILEFG